MDTFSLSPTDGISNIHVNSVDSPVDSLEAVSVFDDNITYYDKANPLGSVKNPNTGTKITIIGESTSQLPYIELEVGPSK